MVVRARLLASVAVLTLIVCSPARANTYEVTRTDDALQGSCKPHKCRLRQAVAAADARPGKDTILLQGGKTYALTVDRLTVTDTQGKLTIRSTGGRRATIDAKQMNPHIKLDGNANLKLQRLVLRNGLHSVDLAHGGSIETQPDSMLQINRSVLLENTVDGNLVSGVGGAISAAGRLAISRSILFRNEVLDANGRGGAIHMHTGRINKTTIAGNQALGSGGGIFVSGPVDVVASAIYDNFADNGGGIASLGTSADLDVLNSTIGVNEANDFGGGIDAYGGSKAVVRNSTVAFNTANEDGDAISQGGGLQNGGTSSFEVRNSLLAQNFALVGFDCAGLPFARAGRNLIGTATDCQGFNPADDLIGANSALRPLRDNGGPTFTFKLGKSSAAINAAAGKCPKRDQRGVERRNCDIGSFERR